MKQNILVGVIFRVSGEWGNKYNFKFGLLLLNPCIFQNLDSHDVNTWSEVDVVSLEEWRLLVKKVAYKLK